MKIDRSKEPSRNTYASTSPQFEQEFNQQQFQTARRPRMLNRPENVPYIKTNIFGGEPLGYFQEGAKEEPTTLWQRLHQDDLSRLAMQPPVNAFEEMIIWTEQGKLWQFPINNEFGMDEEAEVGFEEHVFLEEHLEGFPSKGPIRHFMELVIIGLSKNPYISVERKKENIEWYRRYFKDKEALLKELGAFDVTQTNAAEQSANSS